LSPTGSQQQQQVLLPPQGITNGQVLGSQFLKCESESEEAVLVKHLGVPRLSMQEFLMLHLAKAPQQLDPRALVRTMTYILCMLKQLSIAEPDLPLALKVLPVIPTRAGVVQQAAAAPGVSQGAGQGPSQVLGGPSLQHAQQLVLAPPCELFDPSNAVLVQLLEPRHFPAAPFDGSVDIRVGAGGAAAAEAKALLEGLTLCGLRTKLDLEVRLLFWVA
jgi:sacsin